MSASTRTGVLIEPPRSRGRRTRGVILEKAAGLFAQRPLGAVSVSDIAKAAGAHPSQVTYYFGSKDVLFVHSAFYLLLHDAQRVESVGNRMRTPTTFCEGIARAALALPSLPVVINALAITRRRPQLERVVEHLLGLLFRQSERYLGGVLARHRWMLDRSAQIEVHTFWSAVFGARLIASAGFPGRSGDIDIAGVLTVHAA